VRECSGRASTQASASGLLQNKQLKSMRVRPVATLASNGLLYAARSSNRTPNLGWYSVTETFDFA
jgi:hypothetical protein